MDTGKTYYDTEGNECSIWQMVKREPEWAANRIHVGECAIAEVDRLRAENDRLVGLLEVAYGQKIGTDTTHGLSSCDNFKDWLAALQPTA